MVVDLEEALPDEVVAELEKELEAQVLDLVQEEELVSPHKLSPLSPSHAWQYQGYISCPHRSTGNTAAAMDQFTWIF